MSKRTIGMCFATQLKLSRRSIMGKCINFKEVKFWMVVVANLHLPAVTAQDAGREVYHGRQEAVHIIGDEDSLKLIAWIFQRVPDMFEVQRQACALIVRRSGQSKGS